MSIWPTKADRARTKGVVETSGLYERVVQRQKSRIEELEAQLTVAHTELGKRLLGPFDYCQEHSVMRKCDVPWPCGMCEAKKRETAEAKLAAVFKAFLIYRRSEGCSCCQDTETHEAAEGALGKLFDVPRYSDDSGVDWPEPTGDAT